MDGEIDRIVDAARERRYNDALRQRRSRGTAETTEYRARATCPISVRLDVRVRPEHVAAMNQAAARAGQSRNLWIQELLDDVFGLDAAEPDTS